MALVGETERPEVKKNLDDTEETLNNISNQVLICFVFAHLFCKILYFVENGLKMKTYFSRHFYKNKFELLLSR